MLIDLLNGALANCLDLALQARHAHWNVRGPNFGALRELFGTLAVALDESANALAERTAQVGGVAEGTIRQAARRSRLAVYPLSTGSQQHVDQVASALTMCSRFLREDVAHAAAMGDPITEHVLVEVSREVEKLTWMTVAHSERNL